MSLITANWTYFALSADGWIMKDAQNRRTTGSRARPPTKRAFPNQPHPFANVFDAEEWLASQGIRASVRLA
jgi:hypothetical protein